MTKRIFPNRMAVRALTLLLTVLSILTVCTPALALDEPAPALLTNPATLDMTAPNNQAKALVDKAMSYNGMTRAQVIAAGLPLVDGNWCASFVGLCAEAVGLEEVIPYNHLFPNPKQMYDDVLFAGGKKVTVPQVGDLVFYDYDDRTGCYPESFVHIAIVCGIDRKTNEVYVVQGNAHNSTVGGDYKRSVVCAVGTKCPFCNEGLWSLRNERDDPAIGAFVRPDWSGSHIKNGLVREGSYWYYYVDGVKQTGFHDIDGNTYYFDPKDGHRKNSGTIVIGEDRAQMRYFLDADGAVLKDQWAEFGGKTYYLDPVDGHAVKNCIYDVEGEKYYFDPWGARKCGLVTLNERKYYFSSKSYTMLTGAVNTGSGKLRYFSPEDGHMLKSGWVTVDGARKYYADKNGVLYTGYKTIGKFSYYFSVKDAHLMKGGLVNGPGGNQYYVSAGDGHAMKNGWAQGPDHWWYYLDPSGVLTGQVQQMDRPTYTPR